LAAILQITERRVGHVTVLDLKGRLELDDGDTVLRDTINRLVEEGRVQLLLDLTNVTRLDSAGIGMLVGKYLTVRKRNGTIKLLHLTDRTSRLLHITKLESVFEIFQDEAQALRSFGMSASA
jgi:anti-anti-sigma factor